MMVGGSIEAGTWSSNIQGAWRLKKMGGVEIVGDFYTSDLSAREPIFGTCVRELGVERDSSRMIGIEWTVCLRLALRDCRSSLEETSIHARHVHEKGK